ncbi:unnamed protein product, partial [marine sediment metagenome]
MNLALTAWLGVICPLMGGGLPGQTILIVNEGAQPLHHHTAKITLTANDLGDECSPPDFGRVRFYEGQEGTEPLDFWMVEEQPGSWASFWVRIPYLATGMNWISYSCEDTGGQPYQATSFAARLLAEDAWRLALQTDPPDKETVH